MTTGARTCGWCRGPIGPTQRRDAVYCKTSCRQAAHRFGRHRGAVDPTPDVARPRREFSILDLIRGPKTRTVALCDAV